MSQCNSCHQNHNHCKCNDNSCPVVLSTKCVVYKGSNLDCLGVTKNMKLEDILVLLDGLICDLDPATPIIYVVEGTTGEISVTSATVSGTTTFTVGLDDAIINDITTIQSDIAILQAAVAPLPIVLSTSSAEITLVENSDNNWSIDWTAPTSTEYDGIIYNDLTKSGTSGAGGVQILKSFNNNYTTSSAIAAGDEIRFQIIGQIDPSGTFADTVTVELFNSTTATILDATSYSAFSVSAGKLSSFVFDGVIALSSITDGRYTLKFMANNADNISFSIAPVHVKAYDVNTIDVTALTIRVKFTNNSLATSGNNYVHKLMVEVRKKI